MSKEIVKISYIGSYGQKEIGYTTKTELEEARQGAKAFVGVTDDTDDIKGGKVLYGWTVDYLDIVKVF